MRDFQTLIESLLYGNILGAEQPKRDGMANEQCVLWCLPHEFMGRDATADNFRKLIMKAWRTEFAVSN